MTSEAVFTSWEPKHVALWGQQPLRLRHRLHESGLFSNETLARLIETYPREHYSLVQWGAQARVGP